ncbi:MAG: uroporphyrinogen decarboxylase family protein [Anaerolineae bacterium]
MKAQHPGVMTRRERLAAALRGDPADRTPISLWRHFPEHDARAKSLVQATAAFQRALDLDFIKMMPTGMYSVVDYGVVVRPAEDHSGTTRYVSGPISTPAHWARLKPAPPDRGTLGEQVRAVSLLRATLGPEAPFVQTLFSPLTMAAKMVGLNLDRLLGGGEEALLPGLERMAHDVIAFGRACLAAGVDGFFFATQFAGRDALPPGVYERLGVPFDRMVLEALRPGSWLLLLHLHGEHPLFDLAEALPVDVVNWHDRDTPPSLAEALGRTTRCLAGGISRGGVIAQGSPEEVAAHVREAVAQTEGLRLIVAPGCVIPTTAPMANLKAARQAVEEMARL